MIIQENYGFAPFEANGPKRTSMLDVAHDRLNPDLCHGSWRFTLHQESHMLINAGEELTKDEKGKTYKRFVRTKHPKHADQPYLPGTSLKGMVRSVYEILTHACLSQISGKYKGKEQVAGGRYHNLANPNKYNANQRLFRCTSSDKLCPACLLFGMIPKGKRGHKKHGKHQHRGKAQEKEFTSIGWRGRVAISDGYLKPGIEPKLSRNHLVPVLASPRPKFRGEGSKYHNYFPNGDLAGRKRYQVLEKEISAKRNPATDNPLFQPTPGEVLKPGNQFQFQVSYHNLTRAECGVLLQSILLEEGLFHLLGQAKAHGWGTCRLSLDHWQTFDPVARYRGGDGMAVLSEDERDSLREAWLAEAVGAGLYHPEAFDKLKPFLTPKLPASQRMSR